MGADRPRIKNGSSVFGSGGGCSVDDDDEFKTIDCLVKGDEWDVICDDDCDNDSFCRMIEVRNGI